MTELVIVTDDGPVRTVRMNRPDKKNALTMAMYDAMADAIESAAKTPALRCLLIAGAPTVFCAGNDIGDFLKAAGEGGALGAPILRFLYALALRVAFDCRRAGQRDRRRHHHADALRSRRGRNDARFSTPFVGLGLVPEAASSLIAPRLMGQARAFSLLVMGRPLSANEARSAGLVNTVVAPDAVEAEAMKAAREIAALPPQGASGLAPADARFARRDRRAHRRGSRTVQDTPTIGGSAAAFTKRS